MMTHKRIRLTAQIRSAILASGWSRYMLCKAIGLSQSTMSRFMHGTGGLSSEMLDRIADVLDLSITAGTPKTPPARKRAGRKPGKTRAGGKQR